MRVAAIFALIVCILFSFIGCGEESTSPVEPIPKIEIGLSGDIYMNTKFGIKVSNLPIDQCTVKALGKDGQGMMAEALQGVIPHYIMLLIEPVPAHQSNPNLMSIMLLIRR
jgi:hypothetical protein